MVGALGTLLAFGACALTLLTLAAGRDDALDHARDTSAGVLAILSSDIQRNVEMADLSLQAVAAGFRDPAVMKLAPAIRRRVLFDRSTNARYVSAVSALNAHGDVVEYGSGKPPVGNLADRDYFIVHQRDPHAGLYVSRPYHSRLRGGKPSIALSRRIDDLNGGFAGVAVIAVDLDYFGALLARLPLGPHGCSFILRTDGMVVAGHGATPGVPAPHPFAPLTLPDAQRLLAAPRGAFAARSPADGLMHLFTFARIPGTPLVAVVAPAEADLLRTWRQRAVIVGASALFVGAAFALVIWLLAFALRDRTAMQARLEHMAQTDALTGLDNRRALDRTLTTEWHRMRRTGRALSVLFIDADHFKAYNDEHGHAIGDEALRHIAATLTRHLRRPGDSAARYGGEEFVAVLPDTDAQGAFVVAEAIRGDIGDAHARGGAQLPPFTVSIGCGTASDDDLTLDAFMLRTDAALYAAKTSGRNRVVHAVPATAAHARDPSAAHACKAV